MMKLPNFLLLLLAVVLFSACDQSWNDPYPAAETGNNILYTAFLNRPKHLDPVQSFSEDEINFTAQIYQAPLQYHYLKRPYTVIPATVEAVPHPRLFDARGQELPDDAPAGQVVESLYELRLKPGIMYQPHPAFAVDEAGRHLYEDLSSEQLKDKFVVSDFPQVGTRELKADDYIYQMKRMAHPRLHSPIFGVMSEKIVGLDELGKELGEFARQNPDVAWLDMDAHTLKGVEKVDDYTWRVRIKGCYPQFNFWLTMPCFAPVPREVDR
ncbi:MAG: ABC transporter substrate-binding protein, partial [Azovibrio sp.]